MPLSAGARVGPYEILALIGAGGMGEVYKATDTRLGRTVAIKFLKQPYLDRLAREARTIAALNHPHICTIHDIGPDYLVMEFVEGAPLKGPLALADALRSATEIAEALDAAHAKGIIHRDLKPGNILVTPAGIKLLDFGLAKALEQGAASGDATITQTQAGIVLGTAAYMSPEQAQAKPLDARSDIFSFGAVLYEMLSGRRAFGEDSAVASMAAILHKEPEPFDTPGEVAQIITRCLRKAPADRYQAMAEVKAALQKAAVKPAEGQPSVAVLPFANMSGDKDNEYFSDGLSEEIINALAQLPGLKVTARTSAFAFRGKEQDIRKIAETLNVRNILEGSVRRAGNRIRVTAQLINAADGYHLWSQRYDREMTDVFAVQDEIAAAIAGTLELKLAGRPAAVLRHTPNLPAYEAFLKGRHYAFRGSPDAHAQARAYFEQAIALDPLYAEPHAEMGQLYLVLAAWGLRPAREVMPLARSEARNALELSAAEPRAHAVLGCVAGLYDFDWKQAEEHFHRAMAADPIPPEVHTRYAVFYLAPLGRLEEALAEIEKSLELDPLSALWRSVLSLLLVTVGRHNQAIAEARKALEINESYWLAYHVISLSLLSQGLLTEARRAAEKAWQLAPWHPSVGGLLTGIIAQQGERQQAEELLGQMKTIPPMGRVFYHLLCSEVDAALDWLEKGLEQHDALLLTYLQTHLLEPLRTSLRWRALAQRINLPEAPRNPQP
jgi:TolB-like protein/Tfp pilus assembly protein PilF/predicted Ser/Thr protein kinase